jgi:hypothetical protein
VLCDDAAQLVAALTRRMADDEREQAGMQSADVSLGRDSQSQARA